MTGEWDRVPLGEIAPACSLQLPREDSIVWNLSLEDIQSVTGRVLGKQTCRVAELGSAKCAFDERHVLYSKLRPYLNKVVVPDTAGVGTSELIPLLADKRLDREFLAFYLRSREFVDFANANTRGANLPRISMAELWAHRVPVPNSLDEQRRIVARIKECMERMTEIEANATLAQREVSALFPAILNERFAEIRKTHGYRLLEDVTDIRGGGSLPKGSEIDLGKGAVLLVKVGDMNISGNERVIDVAREYLPSEEAGRGVIPSGAVIFPKRGGAIATNKKRLLGRPARIDPNLMAVVANPEFLCDAYLYYWSQTIDLAKLSNGGVIPQLNRKDLAPLELPVPSLDAQRPIVDAFQSAEDYCAKLLEGFDAAQAERAQLREAILRKAFAGEM
jgi:type I restriction enzyme S subunit